jgi:hypothetical protein
MVFLQPSPKPLKIYLYKIWGSAISVYGKTPDFVEIFSPDSVLLRAVSSDKGLKD